MLYSVFQKQFKVAMIAEMIHTASLIHDDILDSSPVRRNSPTLHCSVGLKTAVLTGDFILSRASRLIASLNNCSVTEILALILEDLVVGELMQADGVSDGDANPTYRYTTFDLSSIKPVYRNFFGHYLERIYYKTASLMANSCKAAAVVTDSSADVVRAAFDFGRLIGMAFQIQDDILDLTGNLEPEKLGKPAMADLSLGLATAPILYAAMKHPQLLEPINRRFTKDGDVALAMDLLYQVRF